MKKKYYVTLIAVFLLACTGAVTAQTIPDSRGKDFYFTFPPNFHDPTDGNWEKDSLFIFVAATEPTKGTIRYRNRAGTSTSKSFTITDVTRMYTLVLPWSSFELAGYNDGGNLISSSQNGTVAPQSFHVTADKDITVYALSQAVTTSDAMMILPTDVLGTDYLVLSYPSDGQTNFFGVDGASTPSQLAVVASQDNTRITITPSAAVLNSGKTPLTLTLQAGDSYLLQAAISSDNLRSDLTGTRVVSDKPIAVFAGHQRCTLPVASDLFSRDYLVEQLPPVSTWGRRYVLTPFPLPASASKTGTDLYRILASEDNTVVMVNDQKRATLQAGEFFEAPLTAASTVTASRNVLVAQYKKSASSSLGSLSLSDPFMLIVPPVRQYLKSYLCINAQAYENRQTVYKEQYMTVICPSAFLSTVRVDDKPINVALFKPVGTSCYSYAWLPMTDGPHRIEAATEIGIYIYGYGNANSYGYTGGMAFRTDDVNKIAFSVSADQTSATPKDTLSFNLKAASDDWSSIALTSMQLEISYRAVWMKPADTIVAGLALDSTWRVQATEKEGATPGEKTLVITASGTTPIAISGTVATVRMVMYLSDELHYTPTLYAMANNNDFCLEVTSQSLSVDLSLCAANLRPIRLTSEEYGFSVSGNGNELHINYGVGLAAPVRLEVFDRLGQLVQSANSTRSPGSYEEVLDIGNLASGLYFVRFSSGPYTQTRSVMLGR